MPTAREWVLSDQTHEFIRSQKWDVAVIPFGATEPHNFHMPYGTDCFQLDVLGDKAVERAYKKGGKVLLLPTMPFGVETNLLKVPGSLALSVNPSTLLKVIGDLVDSLSRQGVKKIVLLNGHGGNELKPHIRELHLQTDAFLCVVEWFKIAADQYKTIFTSPGEHADEIETSLGLAFFSHLTKPPKAGSGKIRPLRFEGMRKGWVSITRPFHLMTADTGLGDPGAATAEKGRQFMDLLVQRLGDFLYELATTPVDDSFPFKAE